MWDLVIPAHDVQSDSKYLVVITAINDAVISLRPRFADTVSEMTDSTFIFEYLASKNELCYSYAINKDSQTEGVSVVVNLKESEGKVSMQYGGDLKKARSDGRKVALDRETFMITGKEITLLKSKTLFVCIKASDEALFTLQIFCNIYTKEVSDHFKRLDCI